jgi:autotransporter translocation and assembly factor TamB
MYRKLARLFLFIVIFFLSIIAIISLILLLAVSTPQGEQSIRNLVQSQVEKQLNASVRIGSVKTNIFTGIRLGDVAINQNAKGKIIPFLTVGTIEARYNLFELLRKKIAVKTLAIDRMTVNVMRDSSGILNIPHFKSTGSPSKKSASGFQFSLDRIVLSKSYAFYQDRKILLEADILGATSVISQKGREEYLFDFKADSLSTHYRNEPLVFSSINLKGDWQSGKLTLGRFSMKLPAIEFDGRNIAYSPKNDSALTGNLYISGNPQVLSTFVQNVFFPALPSVFGSINLSVTLGGSLSVPQMNVLLSFPVLTVGGSPVRNGFFSGRLSSDGARIDSLKIEAFEGNIGGYGQFKFKSLEAENLVLSLRGVNVGRVANLIKKGSPFSGKIDGRIEGSGFLLDPGKLNAKTSFRLYNTGYLEKPVPEIAGNLDLLNGSLSASLHGGGVEFTLNTRISRKGVEGVFSAFSDSLDAIARIAGITGLSGRVSVQGSVGGTFRSPEIAVDVNGRMIKYSNFPVDSLKGQIIYRNNLIGFHDVRMIGSLDSLAGLAPPLKVEGLGGGLQYQTIINGSLDNPQVELTADFKSPAWGEFRFARGNADVYLKDKKVDLKQGFLESDSLRFNFSGTMGIDSRQGNMIIELAKKKPVLKKMPLPQNVESLSSFSQNGSIALDFSFKDIKNPILSAQGKEISLEGLALFFPKLQGAGGVLSFSGSFSGGIANPDAMIDIHIRNPGFREAVLDSAKTHIALKNNVLSVASMELFRGKYYSILDGNIQLEKNSKFFTVTPKSAFSFNIDGDDFDLGFVKPFIPGKSELSGTLSYHLKMNGTVKDPNLNGTISGRKVLVNAGNGVPPVKNMDVDVLLDNTTAKITTKNAEFIGRPIELNFTLNYAPDRYYGDGKITMDGREMISIEGDISQENIRITSQMNGADLSLVELVLPSMKGIKGTVNSRVLISGTRKNPKFEGNLDARNISLDPPWVDMPIKNGIIRMSFSPSQVLIDSVFVRSGNGTIFITGTIDDIINKNWTGQLTGSVKNVRIKQKNLYDAVIKNGNVKYSRTQGSALLSGGVDFGNTKILYKIEPQKFLTSSAPPVKEPPEIFKQIRLQIQVNGGDEFWLDDNLAHIHLHPEINLVGTLAKPSFIGRVEASEGYVLYLDRKFTIQKASLEFINQEELNPTLDIEAQTTVSSSQMNNTTSYTVTINLTGEMKKPQLALSSDPPLDKPDILSLLTLGVTRQHIAFGAAQSDTTFSLQGILLNRAEVLTSLQISGLVGRQLESLLGLEGFYIEGNLFQTGQSSQAAKLVATKRVSDKIEVSYLTSLGSLNEQGIKVLYDLNKNFSLQGQTIEQGQSSLDVLYKMRFR